MNFYSVRYTNAELAASTALLGKELRLYYDSQDLRTVRAMAPDGTDLGVLKAQGAWGEIVHDLKLRQEIRKWQGSRKLKAQLSHDVIERFVQDKLSKAKGSRRAASSLARTVRVLTAAPTSTTLAPPATPATAKEESQRSEPKPSMKIKPLRLDELSRPAPPSGKRIEPEVLAIGTGFAGDIL